MHRNTHMHARGERVSTFNRLEEQDYGLSGVFWNKKTRKHVKEMAS